VLRQAAFNTATSVLGAAIEGVGLGFLPQELLAPHMAEGRLVETLVDWCPMIDGFHLYYPSRSVIRRLFSLRRRYAP
jgi:DNA-binding transcriptional LysR family regulator